MTSSFITNRHNLRIAVLSELHDDARGLVFVMHGLGGFKEQPHIRTLVEASIAQGFNVVSFDATHSFGESDGAYEDAATTNYYEDLQDVIAWARIQPWFVTSFVLMGHSLGGMCVTLYAESHPDEVCGLMPFASVISGALSLESPHYTSIKDEWKRTGWREELSESRPGMIKRLKWSHVEDRMQYDLLTHADALIMPVLFVVGSNDDLCPPAHEQQLFDAVPGRKEMHIVPGAPHNFRTPEQLAQLRTFVTAWLASL